MIKKIVEKLLPRSIWRISLRIMYSFRNYKILSSDFGQYHSMREFACIDKNNNPIPWYSYPAIEYIKQIDVSDKAIFEYGSGNSTLFWAHRCRKIISVEDNKLWYDKVKANLPGKVEYTLFHDKEHYVNAIKQYPEKFDLIIIDGSHRYECAKNALQHLKDDGFIILDNSEWFENTSQALRDANLIEVDMSGFGPINGYTWTTSFYFTRNVRLKPITGRQPSYGIGNLHQTEDEQYSAPDDNSTASQSRD